MGKSTSRNTRKAQTEVTEIINNDNTGETGTAVTFLADESIFSKVNYEFNVCFMPMAAGNGLS